jgi:hypothetical protein
MMNEAHKRMLSKRPARHAPAPWREGPADAGCWNVVDANGNQTAETHAPEHADLIVAAVNFYASHDCSPPIERGRGSHAVNAWLRRVAAQLGVEWDENLASSTAALMREIDRRL